MVGYCSANPQKTFAQAAAFTLRGSRFRCMFLAPKAAETEVLRWEAGMEGFTWFIR